MASFDQNAFDQNAFDPAAFDMGAGGGGGFSAAVYVGGVAVDASGVMGTDFLADGVPVPPDAVFIGGFAHSQLGLRYVCPWPASGLVDYLGGLARRRDGAMCIVAPGAARDFRNGWALSSRGEVMASASAPELVLGGLGLLQNGALCISEAA